MNQHGKLLVETNIVIDFLNGKLPPDNVIYRAEELLSTNVILGELLFGAYNSERVDENIGKVERYIATTTLLNEGKGTATHYGQIKARLKKIGRPIPDNDLWIAAVAAHYGIPVVTRDSHFLVIDEVEVVEPYVGALKADRSRFVGPKR